MDSLAQVRQGDVFFDPVDSIPEGCTPRTTGVVHRGEGSNTHKMLGTNYQLLDAPKVNPLTGEKDLYIIVTPEDAQKLKDAASNPATVGHEEHDHIILAPGKYVVHQPPQREYDGLASLKEARQVTRAVWD